MNMADLQAAAEEGLDREREREDTLAVIQQLSGDGPFSYMRAQDRGAIHELADRACTVRHRTDHVHDGARCIRCRGEADETPHEACMRAIASDPDVQGAQAELDRLDGLVDRAELVLGKAVNRVRRTYWAERRA